MQIHGRKVEVLQYGDNPMLKVEVKLKKGDCKRQTEADYQCLDNCRGNYAYARFLGKQCFSYAALVPVQISLDPQIEWPEIHDLPDLEAIAQERGYELQPYKKGKVLLWRGNHIGSYNPCGLDTHNEWFDSEAQQTYTKLSKRVDELYRIANKVAFEEILHDPALARWLMSPQFRTAILSAFGPECEKELLKLRKLQTSHN